MLRQRSRKSEFVILFEAGWGDFSETGSNECPTGSLGLPWGSARLYGGGKPAYAESIERQTSGFLDAMTSSQIHGSRHSETEHPPQPVAFLFSFVLYYKFKYFVSFCIMTFI